MIHFKPKFTFLLIGTLFLFNPIITNAQFTYFEGGIGNTNIFYPSASKDLYYHNISLRLSGESRLRRYMGFGGELNIPLYEFQKDDLNRSFDRLTLNSRYSAQKMEYSINNSISGSLFTRFYVDTRANFYAEFRVSFLQIKERFVFERLSSSAEISQTSNTGYDLPELPELNINDLNKHFLITPGFSIGIKPHITKKLFFKLNAGVEMYYFSKTPLRNDINFHFDKNKGVEYYTIFKGYAVGFRFPISFNIGLGYFF